MAAFFKNSAALPQALTHQNKTLNRAIATFLPILVLMFTVIYTKLEDHDQLILPHILPHNAAFAYYNEADYFS